MDNKKLLPIIIIILVLAAGAVSFWYRRGSQEEEQKKEGGAVETAETISEAVPEIQTNPGEKVPEINPLDRANPFKYINPLR